MEVKMYKKILVPLDGSELAECALNHGAGRFIGAIEVGMETRPVNGVVANLNTSSGRTFSTIDDGCEDIAVECGTAHDEKSHDGGNRHQSCKRDQTYAENSSGIHALPFTPPGDPLLERLAESDKKLPGLKPWNRIQVST